MLLKLFVYLNPILIILRLCVHVDSFGFLFPIFQNKNKDVFVCIFQTLFEDKKWVDYFVLITKRCETI